MLKLRSEKGSSTGCINGLSVAAATSEANLESIIHRYIPACEADTG